MMTTSVVLYGADSVYSAEVAETLSRLGIEIAAGIITGEPEWDLRGIPQLVEESKIDARLRSLPVVVPWVTPAFRHDRWQRARNAGFTRFQTVVHPTAVVASTANIGEGVFVSAGAMVGAYANLANGTLVAHKAYVGHHSVLEEFVSIAAGATIGGRCLIGSDTMVALGAAVASGLRIGSNSVVALGAAVIRDVPDNVMVAGCPAKVMKARAPLP